MGPLRSTTIFVSGATTIGVLKSGSGLISGRDSQPCVIVSFSTLCVEPGVRVDDTRVDFAKAQASQKGRRKGLGS